MQLPAAVGWGQARCLVLLAGMGWWQCSDPGGVFLVHRMARPLPSASPCARRLFREVPVQSRLRRGPVAAPPSTSIRRLQTPLTEL